MKPMQKTSSLVRTEQAYIIQRQRKINTAKYNLDFGFYHFFIRESYFSQFCLYTSRNELSIHASV